MTVEVQVLAWLLMVGKDAPFGESWSWKKRKEAAVFYPRERLPSPSISRGILRIKCFESITCRDGVAVEYSF